MLSIDSIRSALEKNAINCSGETTPSSVACTDADFVQQRSNAMRIVSEEWCASDPSKEDEEIIGVLLRTVENQISENTGNPLLTYWATEDFEYILRAAYLGRTDPWIVRLWETYRAGINPHANSTFGGLLSFDDD